VGKQSKSAKNNCSVEKNWHNVMSTNQLLAVTILLMNQIGDLKK